MQNALGVNVNAKKIRSTPTRARPNSDLTTIEDYEVWID